MRNFAMVFLSLILTFSAFSQNIKAVAKLDRDKIQIGEQVQLEISVEFPVTENVGFPAFGDTITDAIEIVEKGPVEANYAGSDMSVKILSQKLIVTSFDSGYHTLPPIVFRSEKDSTRTEPLLLSVNDVEVEMSEASQQGEVEIKDIKDIRDIGFSIWEWIKANWYWILLAIFLAAGIWAYIKYIHPNLKKKGPSALIPKKMTPIHELALGRLNALEDKKLWQSGKVKEYHIELTEILRDYIEHRYTIPALESTTDEILKELKSLIADSSVKQELNNILVMADLVKFAKMQPLPDENSRIIKQTRDFIVKTKEERKETEEEVTQPLNV